jgi:GNAT superfamily N-acetyltransferase
VAAGIDAMSRADDKGIEYVDADETLKARIVALWGEVIERHMHIENGFSIVAMRAEEPIGLMSVYWRRLPPPLLPTVEGYIDIIEVIEGYRRKGIATELVRLSAERARGRDAYQLRAWSSEDKVEAIPMWTALGFGLCPITERRINGYFVPRPLSGDA